MTRNAEKKRLNLIALCLPYLGNTKTAKNVIVEYYDRKFLWLDKIKTEHCLIGEY